MYVSEIIIPERAFINHMLTGLQKANDKRLVCLNDDFHCDLVWFKIFLKFVTFDMISDRKQVEL